MSRGGEIELPRPAFESKLGAKSMKGLRTWDLENGQSFPCRSVGVGGFGVK